MPGLDRYYANYANYAGTCTLLCGATNSQIHQTFWTFIEGKRCVRHFSSAEMSETIFTPNSVLLLENRRFAGRGQEREEKRLSHPAFVLLGSSPPQREISIQPDMLIPALLHARSFPLSALQCQRSSDAVNWLMTRTPRATASSLIYTWGQR